VKFNNKQRVVIGGPSRCGKTQLGEYLSGQPIPFAWFPLEGHIYKKIGRSGHTPEQRGSQYMIRPRNTDHRKENVARPLDYFSTAGSNIHWADLPDRAKDSQIIAFILDQYALEGGKDGWLLADIHAELWHQQLSEAIPDLKFLLLYRDPVESICANLYWRTYPSKATNARRLLVYRSLLWALSVRVGVELQRRHPSQVQVFNANHLFGGDKSEIERMKYFLGLDRSMLEEPVLPNDLWFSRPDGGTRFISPEGELIELLDPAEIDQIQNLTLVEQGMISRQERERFPENRLTVGNQLKKSMIQWLGNTSPLAAKTFAELIYLGPKEFTKRQIGR
jgi:hypothetical protein